MRPVKLIVPLIPDQMFSLEEASALRINGLNETWMVEFVLAQWGQIHDYLEMHDFKGLHDYLDVELGEAVFNSAENVAEALPHQNFSNALDTIYEAMMHTTDQLKPFIGRLDVAPGESMVGVMNYSPFTSDSSLVNVFFENPEENWLNDQLLADGKEEQKEEE